MSFVFDIPALVLLGYLAVYLHQTRLSKRNEDALAFLSLLIVGPFWAISFLLLFGLVPNLFAPLLEPLPLLSNCGDGPTFMWNSCLPLSIAAGPGSWLVGLLLLLSYPLWYAWGVERGFRSFGRRAGQEGVLWIFKPGDDADFGAHRKAWGDESSGEKRR